MSDIFNNENEELEKDSQLLTDDLDFASSLDLPDFDESLDFDTSEFSDLVDSEDTVIDPMDIPSETEEDSIFGDNSDDTTLTSDELNNLTSGFNQSDIIEETVTADETSDSFGDINFDAFEEGISLTDENLNDTVAAEETVEEAASEEIGTADIMDDIDSAIDAQVADFSMDLPDFDNFDLTDDNLTSTEETTEAPLSSETIEDTDEVSFDDISADISESISETEEIEMPATEETVIEDSFDMPAEETEISTDSFDIPTEETEISVDAFETTEETTETEEVSFEDMISDSEETEISLDDFMDEGFSDESVAAGNNGYEAGKGPDAEKANVSEEISLDDFFDGEFSIDDTPKQEEEVLDEKPLEMDISFDASADQVETEYNSSVMEDFVDDDSDDETSYTEDTTEEISNEDFTGDNIDAEEIDLSDFGIDAEAEETPVTQDVESAKNREQVIDYDLSVQNEVASSAPVVNEVKIADNVENVDTVEKISESVAAVESTADAIASTPAGNDILSQLAAELANLRAEMKSLKTDLATMKMEEKNGIVTPSASFDNEIIPETPVEETQSSGGFFDSDDGDDTIALSTDELSNIMSSANLTEETVVAEETSADETIVEETIAVETPSEAVEESFDIFDDNVVENEPVIDEETFVEEPSLDDVMVDNTEETIADDTSMFVAAEEPVIEDSFVSVEEPAVEDSFVSVEEPAVEDYFVTTEEPAIEDSFVSVDEPADETPVITEVEAPVIEETAVTETEAATDDDFFSSVDDDFSFDSVDEIETTEVTTEEPTEEFNFADISETAPETEVFETIDTDEVSSIEDDLPAEISIPVDTESEWNMDSSEEVIDQELTLNEEEVPTVMNVINEANGFVAADTVENEIEPETSVEENVFEDVFDTPETVIGETAETDDFAFDSIMDSVEQSNNLTAETIMEENPEVPVEETSINESELSDISQDETIIAENPIDASFEDDFITTDDNNDLTDTNINYLITEDTPIDTPVETEDNTTELKKDIKSVLKYMDQLLENLPEDKIIEFAKSPEYATYKKLFSELGLL